MIAELPPILSGAPQKQISDLRDYLVRLAQSLETVSETAVVEAREAARLVSPARDIIKEEVRATDGALRNLIIKTATEVSATVETLTTDLHQNYVALSTFGEYTETVDRLTSDTAKNTSDVFSLTERIRTLNDTVTKINGEIIRGFVEDPTTHNTVLGIAISQNLDYSTDYTMVHEGNVYYQIAARQTFGLYTSTGWQYWVDGTRLGWFDSEYSKLHVVNLEVETSLKLGDGWVFTTANGLGLKYTGAAT